jgi:hypothetical protein
MSKEKIIEFIEANGGYQELQFFKNINNGAEYLVDFIASIRALSYPTFELFLIDNASSDGSSCARIKFKGHSSLRYRSEVLHLSVRT